MPDTRRLRPVLRVGQHTSQAREFRIVDPDGDPVDVSDADVSLSMEHDKLAYTAIEGGDVSIVDGVGGFVEYDFSAEDTALHGRYRVQFEVEYSDGETALYPPDDHTWVLDVGRRIPQQQPFSAPRISAKEGTFGDLQVERLDADEASIGVLDGDPDIESLSIEDLDVDAFTGGIVGTRGPVVRLDGPNLHIDEHGELASIDPSEDGYTEGADHDHSETGSGGDTLRPSLAVVAEEFGLPEYDDVANAPQTPGRVVYVTGDGESTEGLYKHGEDSYQRVLTAGDDFDGQGTSSFTDLAALDAEELNDELYAPVGELQATLDYASENAYSKVTLYSGAVYDEGAEIEVPPDLTVDVNNATIQVSGDHNGVFLDNGADVHGGAVTVTADSYSSSPVVLDQTRSTRGKYSNLDAANYRGEINGPGADVGGDGLHLITDSTTVATDEAGITGCEFEGQINECERGIHCETIGEGWINSVEFDVNIRHCMEGFSHTGAGLCQSTLRGAIQMGYHENAIGINSPGDGDSILHYGRIWDVETADGQLAISGTGVKVVGSHVRNYEGKCEADSRVYGLHVGWPGMRWYDFGSGEGAYIEFDPRSNGDVMIGTQEGDAIRLGVNGRIRAHGKYFFAEEREDLTSRTPIDWTEQAYHNGESGPTASLCFATSESTWYNIRDDVEF